jgi:hypothetical protein
MAVNGAEKRSTVSVDEAGRVQRTNRPAASPNANWLGRMSENQATLVVIGALIGVLLLVSFVANLFHFPITPIPKGSNTIDQRTRMGRRS